MRTDNLVIPQGATWGNLWPLKDSDGNTPTLTGWDGRAQVRTTHASDVVLYEWSTALGNLNLTTEGLLLTVEPAVSAAWDWSKGVYDVELFHTDGTVIRLTQGAVTVDPEVTR